MVKRNQSKQSSKALTGNTPDTLEKKESNTHRSHSGAKAKRAPKRQAQAKSASKKKTRAKKTKRTGRKAAGRKAAHHEEHSQVQGHETASYSNE